MPAVDAIEQTLEAIRARGGRVTEQRRAILHTVFAGGDLLTVDELARRVRDELPDVHIATVYRFLETLEGLGLVTHVHLGHGPSAFHLTSGRSAHVVCDGCGAVAVIAEEMFEAWSDQLRAASGFELTEQHFALSGRCARCSNAAGADR